MKIGVLKETHPGELRVALVPDGVRRLLKLGATCDIEGGAGLEAGYPDDEYIEAGATVTPDRNRILASSDLLVRVRKPPAGEISLLHRGCIHISFLDPFNEMELIEALARHGVTAFSLEMVPRTTRAQKMDALSSQANLAGYVAVILGATHLIRILPMMTTPAGTIAPARVFVIGAGVAGLQAIATAKRLGARVEAYDTRAEVEEQVRSLGGRFAKIDLGETGRTADGYAKALTPQQLEIQRQAMGRFCHQADMVITTAQVFGRKSPVIVTGDMISGMRAGSVVVDLAVESGGNVEGIRPGETYRSGGVTIVAQANLPSCVPHNASQVYSSNLVAMVEEYWDKGGRLFKVDRNDEIIRGSLITHNNEIVNERLLTPAGR